MTPNELETALAELDWLEPWAPLRDGGPQLERELQRALGDGHVLHGRTAHAVARRQDNDDVLFLLEAPAQLAVVHLTHAREKSPAVPPTIVFDSVGEFVEGCLQPDHHEYADDLDDD